MVAAPLWEAHMSGLLQCWNEVAKLTGRSVCNAAEEGGSWAVEVGLQEAIDILTAATKGCGSYAKPILRHITTVAEFAKREGVQVCNASDLHGLSAMCMNWICGMECYVMCKSFCIPGTP